MIREQCEGIWANIGLAVWDRYHEQRLEVAVVHYQQWLSHRKVWVPSDEPWDSSGHLVDDAETTRDERIAMYETLGEWAVGEYTGHSEATFLSGRGLRYPNLMSELLRDDDAALYGVLMCAVGIDRADPAYDDVRQWAMDWIDGCEHNWCAFLCMQAAAFSRRIEGATSDLQRTLHRHVGP